MVINVYNRPNNDKKNNVTITWIELNMLRYDILFKNYDDQKTKVF